MLHAGGCMNGGNFLAKNCPELDAGGFSAVDGTIEFYGRINALLKSNSVVLDFGGGRGAWFEDDTSDYRKSLRLLKGKVAKVIACDVDPAVLENRSVDEAFVVPLDSRLPLGDESVDLIVSDFVFEHVTDPSWMASEFNRILRPGGWICARTPTKYCYVSLVARLVKSSRH
jgi:ubiquinone/menaquinone biosynthesis C-methylase UbiE